MTKKGFFLTKMHFSESKAILIIALAILLFFNSQAISFITHYGEVTNLHFFFFKSSILITIYTIILTCFAPFYLTHQTNLGLATIYFISSITSYFSSNFGIIFDENVAKSIFETTFSEFSQYLNVNLILWLALHISITVFFLFILKLNQDPFVKKLKTCTFSILMSAIMVTAIGLSLYKDYASFLRNNRQFRHMIIPVSPIYETIKYFKAKLLPSNTTFIKIGEDAKRDSKYPDVRKTIILILGETARADHFSINGYKKNITNPMIEQLDLVSFSKVTSCGTATSISLPCLFSDLGRKSFSLEVSERRGNILDIIQKSGYEVLWIDNNTGCQGVCDRVKKVDITPFQNSKICKSETCYDEILIHTLQSVLNKSKNQFIILHMLGSHGPSYYKRYPKEFEKFKPSCNTSDLSLCTNEQVINTYDNTLLYTDFIISRAISTVSAHDKNSEKLVIYLSDHGESLGENGLYLHSLPYFAAPMAQKHVPLLFWFEKFTLKNHRFGPENLKTIKDCPTSHDFIFSTLLNLLEIKTSYYKKNLDLLSMKPERCEILFE